jgi:hypothetical protein
MIPDNWPPPATRKVIMKASTAVALMALISISIIALAVWTLNQDDWGEAGWVLLIAGTFCALSTVGSLSRHTR